MLHGPFSPHPTSSCRPGRRRSRNGSITRNQPSVPQSLVTRGQARRAAGTIDHFEETIQELPASPLTPLNDSFELLSELGSDLSRSSSFDGLERELEVKRPYDEQPQTPPTSGAPDPTTSGGILNRSEDLQHMPRATVSISHTETPSPRLHITIMPSTTPIVSHTNLLNLLPEASPRDSRRPHSGSPMQLEYVVPRLLQVEEDR